MRIIRIIARFDWVLFLAALALASVGLVVMYGIGISRPEVDLFLFQKQLVGAGIGVTLLLLLSLIDYRQIRGLAFPVYVGGALMLGGVLLFGETIRGTRGWYVIGGLSFQPVELAKICLIIFLAAFLTRFAHKKLSRQAIATSFAATMVYVAFVFFQPDFGSAMVMLAIWFFMIAFVGLQWRTIGAMVLVGVLASILAWQFVLQPYQKNRFIAFMNPAADARGAGYNVRQAQIALGSGGLLGKGIGEGSQSRLRFLPEAATDFTFAVLGEELGFLGITFVLGLFALLIHRLYCIATAADDDFAKLVLLGMSAFFLIHLLIAAGMNMGLMPVTGIPLPFLSAASSYLLVAFIALGLAESIFVHRRAQI